ncbi:MAG: hypothetical protein U9O41_00190 [Candidatus Aerophobetes bacterium]|nr:hypothetical protein [Candidatus Aerophobetes bacterium]
MAFRKSTPPALNIKPAIMKDAILSRCTFRKPPMKFAKITTPV